MTPARNGVDIRHLAVLHGAVALFGFAGLFGKWLILPPVLIVFWRVAVATAGFLLLRLGQRRREALPGGRVTALLGACGVLLALHWITFFQAIQVSSVAVGLLAYSTAPVFVALLEPFWFREPLRIRPLLCAGLTLGGVALIVPEWDPGAPVFLGVAWGVASGGSFAVLSLLNRGLVRQVGAWQIALYQDGAALLVLAPLLPWVWVTPTGRDMALLVVLGLFCTALAHGLYIHSLRRVPAWVAAVTSALEPLYGTALAALLLAEHPAPRTLAGGVLIIGAVLWAVRSPGSARQNGSAQKPG